MSDTRDTILIVDDEESIRNQLRWGLGEEYEVLSAGTADEARRLLRSERPSLVTLDVALGGAGRPGEEGLVLLDEIVDQHPHTKVIMVTGNTRPENALLALRRGAVDWYGKPIELEELRAILRRALHIRAIEQAEETVPAPGRKRYHRLIGESEPMRKVFTLVQRVGPTDATVLVVGETGTGKELVARAIHDASPRAAGPFVPVNCGAIPETLIESELFGHERGAFTGAHRMREGSSSSPTAARCSSTRSASCRPSVQVKLLRFLQDHRVERIGGRESEQGRRPRRRRDEPRPRRGDGRAATSARTSTTGSRSSTVTAPPLRDRGDDVALLADYFLEFYANHHKRRLRGFTQSALRALAAHPWPGNVRELENRVERAVILAQDAHLRPEDLELQTDVAPGARTLQDAREVAERETLVEALVRNAGNITRAARDIDVSRPTFHDLLRKHGIDATRYRKPGALATDSESETGDEA